MANDFKREDRAILYNFHAKAIPDSFIYGMNYKYFSFLKFLKKSCFELSKGRIINDLGCEILRENIEKINFKENETEGDFLEESKLIFELITSILFKKDDTK